MARLTHLIHALLGFIGHNPGLAFVFVFLISMGEALFLVGLFVPSTAFLVGAGTLIGLGELQFLPIFLAAILGAVAGDALSFVVGWLLRDRIREHSLVRRYQNIFDRGEAFFLRHGGKSVFIGRFIPGVKAIVPGVAGMSQMGPARFSLINVLSAIAWSAAHLLPGIAIGHGLESASANNPRVLQFALFFGLLVGLAWFLSRLALNWVMPHAERLQIHLGRTLQASGSPLLQSFGHRLLRENGMLFPVVFSLGAVTASAFLVWLSQAVNYPVVGRADLAIQHYIRAFRLGSIDQFSILMTAMGDKIILLPTAYFIALVMWIRGEKRLGLTTAGVITASAALILFLKIVVHRARPDILPQAPGDYSFPSGHATLSTIVFGMSALLLTWDRGAVIRRLAYFSAILLTLSVAFSRVYLGEHWPTDVLGGMALGSATLFTYAYYLHGREFSDVSARLRRVLPAVYLVLLGVFLAASLHRLEARFTAQPEKVASMDAATWTEGAWSGLPDHRMLLNGHYGEPMLAQTDFSIPRLRSGLTHAGWREDRSGELARIIDTVLPADLSFRDALTLPLTNSGRVPVSIFTHPLKGHPSLRAVLRIWQSGTQLSGRGGPRPIYLISETFECQEPLFLGYSLIRPARLDHHDYRADQIRLADALGISPILEQAMDGKLYLILQ